MEADAFDVDFVVDPAALVVAGGQPVLRTGDAIVVPALAALAVVPVVDVAPVLAAFELERTGS